MNQKTFVDKTLDFVKGRDGILGVLIIIGKKLGVWGDIRLVTAKP